MAVSADDRYILSYDELNGVAVDSTTGSHSILVPSSINVRALAPSTNALSDLIVESNGSTYDVYGYREPYTSSYGHVSIPTVSGSFNVVVGFAAAANLDGSQVFIAQRNGPSTQVSIGNLSTGSVQTSAFPESKGEIPASLCTQTNCSAYDPRHQWFYFFSSTDGTTGTINRVQIFATSTRSYLGYLNLPSSQTDGLTLNINNSDLYVQVGQRIYVYNVGSCGCATVRRTFTIQGYAGTNPTLDRSGTHLFTQGFDPANQYTTIVYDFNPQTGALQHTFTVANGSAGFPDFLIHTVGQ